MEGNFVENSWPFESIFVHYSKCCCCARWFSSLQTPLMSMQRPRSPRRRYQFQERTLSSWQMGTYEKTLKRQTKIPVLSVMQEASSFYTTLATSNISVNHRLDLSYTLFRGISFQLRNVTREKRTAKSIAKMKGVKQIWPVHAISLPKHEVIWTGTGPAPSGTSMHKRQSFQNDTFSPHTMTQVDKLRAEGITGKGVRIGIVDTGVRPSPEPILSPC